MRFIRFVYDSLHIQVNDGAVYIYIHSCVNKAFYIHRFRSFQLKGLPRKVYFRANECDGSM